MKITTKDCVCAPAQHTAVMGDDNQSLSAVPVVAGNIAVLPRPSQTFVDAVTGAGGIVAPLDQHTRGIIWLSYARTAELGEILATHPNISWVQLPFAGVDAFSEVIATHSAPHRVFTSAKGAYAQPVAEHALALILAVLRFIPLRSRATAWNGTPLGISLYGLNVTIVGAGGSARELIRLLSVFGVNITVVRRQKISVPGVAATVTSSSLSSVLPDSDVIVVMAALTAHTRHLIGQPEFALMKESAAFVNIARGGLVDSAALAAALDAGKLLGAAVDVTEPEPLPDGHALWTAPNMLITPHMADTPDMTAPLLAERIRSNVQAFLQGLPFVGVVDTESGY